MTIEQIVSRMSEIALQHLLIKSVYVGNTWDNSASKGDIYNCVWIEFPVLVEYGNTPNKQNKTYTFSFNVLGLPSLDSTVSEMEVISEMESIADNLGQAFNLYIKDLNVVRMNALSIKNVNADIACGVRVDIQVSTNRDLNACGTNNFKSTLIKK